VTMKIAHDLNFLVRSTAGRGAVCVVKQPHDNAGALGFCPGTGLADTRVCKGG
jgi:hypothetical protein